MLEFIRTLLRVNPGQMKKINPVKPVLSLTPEVMALRAETSDGNFVKHCELSVAGCTAEVCQGINSLWIVVSRPNKGGFALRSAYSPGLPIQVEIEKCSARQAQFIVLGTLGKFKVQLETPNSDEAFLHCTVAITPGADLLIPSWPRDLYPLNIQNDPAATAGVIHAAQRGLNTGVMYLSLDQPRFGSLLYLQNLTALNDYFRATQTTPDGCVGGQWPELGYAPPISQTKPLPAGREIVFSDVFLRWSEEVPESPQQSAQIFLDLLAGIYAHLEDRPESEYHDWPQCAAQTLHDLCQSPKATVRHYGHTFIHPYTDTEYPDSMVQLAILNPLQEYAAWLKRADEFTDKLRSGVPRFFDANLGSLRRYLPNVGNDKNPDEVDSWYLYHPLANLGRLAGAGDEEARSLFLRSLDYAIMVARHFHYQWPVQFDIQTLEVITGERKPGEPGQSDAGGLYAYVMLQAYDFTGEDRYLDEAKQAIQAIEHLEFNIEYQANITAWGANACLRLFRLTGDRYYLTQSYVFLASFFHNSIMWESQIAAAKHYPVFLGATCLHDGPYMALYECFEAYASFHEYLCWGQSALPDSVRLLLTEYCKYALSRAWYYYPAHLPQQIIAKDVRNGQIDSALAFPMEDLYADGQPPGQVGQEIYGCGAAFTFVTRSYHLLKNAPFQLYCEYPIFDIEESNDPCLTFRVRGVEGFSCRARLLATGETVLPEISVRDVDGRTIRGHKTKEGHWECHLPASRCIEFRWTRTGTAQRKVP